MLVNTCAVRDHAEQRVLGRVGELKRHKRPGRRAGRGRAAWRSGSGPGCSSACRRSTRDRARRLPQPPRADRRAAGGARTADVEFRGWEHYEDVPAVRDAGPTPFVTVQRGCDYRCTFCIVPMTRGPERSRMLADVVRRGDGRSRSAARRR